MDVRLSDGQIWGPRSSLVFRLNTPPGTPTLVGPADLSVDQGPASVTLRWNLVTDADGDPVSYRWSRATNSNFTSAKTGAALPGNASADVPTAGSTRYYWRIEAYDQYAWSPPSITWSFTTRASAGKVLGRVVHAGGGLLAVVRLYNSTGVFAGEARTETDGSFNISGLPFDVYEVRVRSASYHERIIPGVALSVAAPVKDLGDIELVSDALETSTVLSWAILVAGVVSAIAAAGILVSRRRRDSESPQDYLEDTLSPPSDSSIPGGTPGAEEIVFECPACGTQVSADTKTCPGCGAIFEESL